VGAAVRLHPLRQIRSDARSKTPHAISRARLNGFRLGRPPALAAGGALPETEPTSDVPCHHRGTFSSAPPTSALGRSRLSTITSFTATARSVRSFARLRAASHHLGTPAAVSRTKSCDPIDARMRIRPRESSLSHPFVTSSFVPPSKGERTAPWLDRAPNAVPAAACDRASRRTQQVIDQRCVRPAFANDTSTTGTHVRSATRCVLRQLARTIRFGWMARFTTPHSLRMRSIRWSSGRVVPVTSTEPSSSDAPVAVLRLPSVRLAPSRGAPPVRMEEEVLREPGRDHLLGGVP